MAESTVKGLEHSPIFSAVKKLQPSISEKEAIELTAALRKVTENRTCTVPWQLLLSIAYHESSLNKKAFNKKSIDYGLMQISKANVVKLKLNKDRLMSEHEYSLASACTIINYNKKNYSNKVSYWLGIYRSGIALWKNKISKNAIDYDRIIRKTAVNIGYKEQERSLASNNAKNNKR